MCIFLQLLGIMIPSIVPIVYLVFLGILDIYLYVHNRC